MSRRLGPYAPLSATYYHDDALAQAGEKAETLYVRGLAFCATSMSDGFITDNQVVRSVGIGMNDAMKRANALADAGAWERVEGGFVVRGWLKWNKSAEQIGREKARDRQRKADAVKPSVPLDSERKDDGFRTESSGNPVGIQTESEGIPTSHAPAPAGMRLPARTGHATPLHTTPVPPNGGALVKEHLDAMTTRPPDRVVGQTAKLVGELLAEGISDHHIRAGLELLRRKSLNPASLPSLVNESMNPPKVAAKPSTADQRVADGYALAEKFANNPTGVLA